MCGIVAIYNNQLKFDKDIRAKSLSMSKKIRHRGPDGYGTFISQNTSMFSGGGFTSSHIMSIALDLDNGKIFFAKDGAFRYTSGNTGDPANGTNPTKTISDTTKTYTFYTELRGNDNDGTLVNFGGNPPFSISSGNSDANGHGNFEYAVPSGFLALCTKNIAENG